MQNKNYFFTGQTLQWNALQRSTLQQFICMLALLLGLYTQGAWAITVPAANFLLPNGTLNTAAIGNQQLSLDLKGWNVSLDPNLGPVFAPAAADGFSAFDKGLNGSVYAIAVSGSDVYVGGGFTNVGSGGTAVAGLNYIAKWNGTAWSALDKGLNNIVLSIAVSGNDLYVGGGFTNVGSGGTAVAGAGLNRIAKWNGTAWSALDKGLDKGMTDGGGSSVRAIAVSGNDLYVGGVFTDVGPGGIPVTGLNNIAKWNGTAWSALDRGLSTYEHYIIYDYVSELVVSGSDLYVGGKFSGVGTGSTPVTGLNNIAKWNGTTWSALDKGLNSPVKALAVSGSDVYVGGGFSGVGSGGNPVTGLTNIAKWNGTAWSALGTGLDSEVYTLTVSGSDVYVGGQFRAVGSGGTSVGGLNYIAKWNGSAWSALDKGLNNAVYDIAVFGKGDVYFGGNFTDVGSGGTAVAGLNSIAKWGEITNSPTITTTGTLTAFTACAGTASTQQSFSVSGSNLTANITVTAPTGFVVSKTSSSGINVTFTTSVTLTPTSGSVASTTIYVRMAATATGTPSGNVTLSSTGATDKTVAVSGMVKSYSLEIGSGSNPTTCNGTDGFIRFLYYSGDIPNGTYIMSYRKGATAETKNVTFGPSPTRIAAGASSPLTATLSGLGAGSYSNFKITVNGCVVTATGSSPVVLSDPALPTFTVGTKINPTTCGGSEGSIALTGLTASTSYSVSYQKNGAAATVTTLSSNASGVLTIPSLTAGSFTNITVTLGNCTSAASSTTLSNPSYAISIGTATNPTTCGGTNGSIRFASDNVATGTYPISFSKDMSTVTGTITFTSPVRVGVGTSISKTATLSGLSAGSYSNFKITVNGCEVTATGTAPVNLSGPTIPTFSISTLVNPTTCGNTNGSIPLTGLTASKSYSVSYQKDGAAATVTTLSSNASGVLTLSNLDAGSYTNITVTLGNCSSASATASLSNPPAATASISGTTSVCQNASNSVVIFTGANGTGPYSFGYRLNGGALQTLTTTGTSSSAFISQSTSVAGVYRYELESVNDAQNCGQNQTGSATVTVQGKPTVGLSIQQVNLGEGSNQTLCDTDTNPVNGLQFTVGTGCTVGNPVWRTQIGAGAWSAWSSNIPSSQPTDNQAYKYQAACNPDCPTTFTSPISVTINYRAATPQNVSMVADGTTVAAGEEKSICDQTGNALTFNATCATGESLIYSVDGSVYTPTVPTQMVDGQYHNYRVRCQKTDGTVSCVETASGVMRLKISAIAAAPVASLNVTSGCGTASSFSGTANCNGLTTVWYNATTNAALPNLPTTTPNETTSYYARCQGDEGCQSEKSNTVTFTLTPVSAAPVVSVSSDLVCTGTEVTVSTSCPSGASALWNTGVTGSSFKVAFGNVTTQGYSAKCVFENGCQSPVSATKTVRWKGFELTLINIGQSKSAIKTNDRAAWASQFVTADAGPSLDNSTESNPTLYYSENVNKTGPRYWTIHADACALGTSGSMTFDLLATPETGVVRSFNTHENNAPYFMYANREGYTELYAQNHPAYGFFLDNGSGVNVYDEGLPKGLYKLGVRYWDQKGWGSIFPSTRKPQGSVLAYQEYWFRIQSKDGIGTGAARVAANDLSPWKGLNPLTFAEIVPNPVSNVLRLKVTEAKNQKVNVSLLDASGRTLLQRNFVPETNQHQEEFNVSELANGMYFLRVNAGDKQATLKVVKVE